MDVVEAFHFVEYSALTLLFAGRSRGPAGEWAWLWAAYAALLVGAVDEWTQWFVPGRTGEIRDVAINGISMTLRAAARHGRSTLALVPRRGARLWPLGAGAAVVMLVVAGFFAQRAPGLRASRRRDRRLHVVPHRARGWRRCQRHAHGPGADRGPAPQGQFSRENQYLSEALWHVRRRNEAMDDDDLVAAWRENRILEKYFAPVLRIPTADGAGHALAAVQVAGLEPGRAAAAGRPQRREPDLDLHLAPRGATGRVVLAVTAVLVAADNTGGGGPGRHGGSRRTSHA